MSSNPIRFFQCYCDPDKAAERQSNLDHEAFEADRLHDEQADAAITRDLEIDLEFEQLAIKSEDEL